MKTSIMLSVAAVASALAVSPGFAGDSVKSSIPIYFLGVHVGTLTNDIRVDKDRYAIRGRVAANSVVALVARAGADFESSGRIAGRLLKPESHRLRYRQRKKKGSVQLAFARGGISDMTVSPKVRYGKTAVPVVASHLRDVLDPISSVMLPVNPTEINNGSAICNRTLPVFDGKNRMNLKLRYKSSKPRQVKGFSGPTFTCSVRYQPVAGHKPERKETKFMKANRDIEVTFARVGESNLYALFGFRIKTRAGRASGQANQFQSF